MSAESQLQNKKGHFVLYHAGEKYFHLKNKTKSHLIVRREAQKLLGMPFEANSATGGCRAVQFGRGRASEKRNQTVFHSVCL